MKLTGNYSPIFKDRMLKGVGVDANENRLHIINIVMVHLQLNGYGVEDHVLGAITLSLTGRASSQPLDFWFINWFINWKRIVFAHVFTNLCEWCAHFFIIEIL